MRYRNEDAPLIPQPHPFLVSSLTVYSEDMAVHQPFADSPNWDTGVISRADRKHMGPIHDKDDAPASLVEYLKWMWYHLLT
jgi:hypothetical protein